MKKFVKMSLVAAVAVAGLTTTSSAKDLSEAIKGVDFSGSLTYRYDDGSIDYDLSSKTNKQSAKNNRYKLVLKTKAPINDTVTANVVAAVAATTNTADGNPGFVLPVASFTAKIAGASITVGKQGIATPWTTAGHYIDGMQSGSGVTVAYPVGGFTLAAAHFLNNNIAGITDNGITVAAILGKVGVVDGQLWYLNAANAASSTTASNVTDPATDNVYTTYDNNDGYGAKGITATLGANIGPVRVDLRHADLKSKEDGSKKQKFDAIKASVKVASVKIGASYVKGGKDGDAVSLDGNLNDANAFFTGWGTYIGGTTAKYDADSYGVCASVALTSTVTAKINYATLDYKTDTNAATKTTTVDDLYAQISYKMSSNFSGYVRLGTVATDAPGTNAANDKTQTRGRLQVKYTF